MAKHIWVQWKIHLLKLPALLLEGYRTCRLVLSISRQNWQYKMRYWIWVISQPANSYTIFRHGKKTMVENVRHHYGMLYSVRRATWAESPKAAGSSSKGRDSIDIIFYSKPLSRPAVKEIVISYPAIKRMLVLMATNGVIRLAAADGRWKGYSIRMIDSSVL